MVSETAPGWEEWGVELPGHCPTNEDTQFRAETKAGYLSGLTINGDEALSSMRSNPPHCRYLHFCMLNRIDQFRANPDYGSYRSEAQTKRSGF
ncbi:hypothetical protein DESC_580036 [Desulfosarcina cetonica]|nr:hypothetical protein DESC_580036 [Desulfosarcina cetonica]